MAALIMLQGHVFHSSNGLARQGPALSQFLGGLAPAVFLFLTGVTMAFRMDSDRAPRSQGRASFRFDPGAIFADNRVLSGSVVAIFAAIESAVGHVGGHSVRRRWRPLSVMAISGPLTGAALCRPRRGDRGGLPFICSSGRSPLVKNYIAPDYVLQLFPMGGLPFWTLRGQRDSAAGRRSMDRAMH
jgi:hypothetical protein